MRTDGITFSGVEPEDIFLAEEGAMTNIETLFGGENPNNFIFSVQGYGGNKINYNLTGSYIFIGNI